MNLSVRLIDRHAPAEDFPDPEQALDEPNGLLAIGGDLEPERLLAAYRRGIFPWYSTGQPLLWWSPDPRMVLFPERFHRSRSLRKTLRRGVFQVTVNRAFHDVILACAAPRTSQDGTWILPEMALAYRRLHSLGWAHSIECWQDGRLCGGLYGVAIGGVFFGESMFSRATDASKVALDHLCGMGFRLIDGQVESPHLVRLGAEAIPRSRFLELIADFADAAPGPAGSSPLEAAP